MLLNAIILYSSVTYMYMLSNLLVAFAVCLIFVIIIGLKNLI